jgi:HEAT repeat protein
LSQYIKKTGFFKNKRRNGAWDEVVYTLVGITDANKLFLKLAEIDPFLTVDCFEHVSQEIEINEETIKFITGKIIYFFGSRNPQAREAAILKAVQLGSITLPYLIDLLENGNKVAKRASLKALSQFDEPLAFKTIVLALENSNKWVRKDAEEILDSIEASQFESLVEKQDENVIAVLKKYDYIKTQSVNVRLYAIKTLEKLGDTKIVDKLIPYLQDEYAVVRNSTIDALAQLGDAEIIDKIIPYLQDENPVIRNTTKHALKQLGYEPY